MEYSFLRVKNPNNQATKAELCRVVYHLMDIIGFSDIDIMWYEKGKQNQQHIHAIIKKKMPTDKQLQQMSKTFKTKKMKWFEYGQECEELGETIGTPIIHKMDTAAFNWQLTEIKDKQHYNEIKYEYRFKECKPEFIDD